MIALPDEAVAVVLSLQVPPANIATFDRIWRKLIDAARRKGADFRQGAARAGGERQALAARAKSLATRAARNQLTGMEAWFDIPSGLPIRHAIVWLR